MLCPLRPLLLKGPNIVYRLINFREVYRMLHYGIGNRAGIRTSCSLLSLKRLETINVVQQWQKINNFLFLCFLFFFRVAIDGNYTEWSEWSDCSLTCGGGLKTRARQCTSPPPQYGGKTCERLGRANETLSCSKGKCREFLLPL